MKEFTPSGSKVFHLRLVLNKKGMNYSKSELFPFDMYPPPLNGPLHAKAYLRAYADREGPDQPAHPRSLIRASMSANRIIGHYRIHQWRENAQIGLCACAGRIWICAFCACSKTPFVSRPKYVHVSFYLVTFPCSADEWASHNKDKRIRGDLESHITTLTTPFDGDFIHTH